MNLAEYKNNPCRNASLQWYKMKNMQLPLGMRVIHKDEFNGVEKAEPYFRLIHRLINIKEPLLSKGMTMRNINVQNEEELRLLSIMIKECYPEERLPVEQMREMITSPYFQSNLWLVITDDDGKFVASGISEFDPEVPEGILDWIQVIPKYHKQGLGKAIVNATLQNLKEKAEFVTVSGRVNNQTYPESLYKSCGFEGDDIWYIVYP